MLFAATPAPAQADGFAGFFAQYGLLILLLILIVFMFWSSRRRQQRMKAEQEEKASKMLPGAKVLLQGGLYGTIVEYDGDDLSKSAHVELAPGVVVEVHSQAVLRIVEDEAVADADEQIPGDDVIESTPAPESVEKPAAEAAPDTDDKPKA